VTSFPIIAFQGNESKLSLPSNENPQGLTQNKEEWELFSNFSKTWIINVQRI
jgi:hypothetical protein